MLKLFVLSIACLSRSRSLFFWLPTTLSGCLCPNDNRFSTRRTVIETFYPMYMYIEILFSCVNASAGTPERIEKKNDRFYVYTSIIIIIIIINTSSFLRPLVSWYYRQLESLHIIRCFVLACRYFSHPRDSF